jgi:hypothetical protein
MEARGARLAQNEIIFRDINELLAAGHKRFHPSEPQEFLCECADELCSARIRLTVAEYERVRSNPRRFAIRAGHDLPEIEDVIEFSARFVIVEKRGPAARAAEDADPRTQVPPADASEPCTVTLVSRREATGKPGVQAQCSCDWESPWLPTRAEAIAAHQRPTASGAR